MNINSVNNISDIYKQVKHTGKKNAFKAGNAEITKGLSSVDPDLQYYKELCAEFPSITFRLDDVSAYKNFSEGDVYLGYNNSMNQVGDNFGKIGQSSIEIDIAVIRRMKEDPSYEREVRWTIKDISDRYGSMEADTIAQGFRSMCALIQDDNGRIQVGKAKAMCDFSTEEEVKRMWGKSENDNFIKIVWSENKINDELFDNFMKMTETKKRNKIAH